jgi:hypothetical protein
MALIRLEQAAYLAAVLRMHRLSRCPCEEHQEKLALMESGLAVLAEKREKRRSP